MTKKERPDLAPTAVDINDSPRRRRRVPELHEDQQRRIAINEQSRSTTNLETDDLALISNWMRRINKATTFAGADRLLLLMLTDRLAPSEHRLPLDNYGTTEMCSSANDERRLTIVDDAIDHFFNRCEDIARHIDLSFDAIPKPNSWSGSAFDALNTTHIVYSTIPLPILLVWPAQAPKAMKIAKSTPRWRQIRHLQRLQLPLPKRQLQGVVGRSKRALQTTYFEQIGEQNPPGREALFITPFATYIPPDSMEIRLPIQHIPQAHLDTPP